MAQWVWQGRSCRGMIDNCADRMAGYPRQPARELKGFQPSQAIYTESSSSSRVKLPSDRTCGETGSSHRALPLTSRHCAAPHACLAVPTERRRCPEVAARRVSNDGSSDGGARISRRGMKWAWQWTAIPICVRLGNGSLRDRSSTEKGGGVSGVPGLRVGAMPDDLAVASRDRA